MTRRLLLVDATNLVMRCAFGGDVAAPRAVQLAMGMLARAIVELRPSHVVCAFDSPSAPSWRKQLSPTYKAHRTVDTGPFILAFAAELEARHFYTTWVDGFEADDIIATITDRWYQRRDPETQDEILILSNDSDLLALVRPGVTVARPETGGTFTILGLAAVLAKYGIRIPEQVTDYKALCGETGDGIAGVPGIGPKKATALLAAYDNIEAIITAGAGVASKDARTVFEHSIAAQIAYRLVALRTDVPIPPIVPAKCAVGAPEPMKATA